MNRAPELIVLNPNIITMDERVPSASGMAVSSGRITAIGGRDEVLALAADETVVREVKDGAVVPGFVDAHNHPLQAGITDLFELSISPEASVPEICAAVSTATLRSGPGSWVLGSGWGTSLLVELEREASLAMLDAASGGHAVLLVDDSRHNRWANSRALELAGITDQSQDPELGRIVRDRSSGRPTGLLFESAGLLVEEVARRANVREPADFEAAAHRALELLAGYGITTVQDAAASIDSMRAFAALDRRGELNAWVVSSMTVNDQIFGYSTLGDDLIAQRENVATPRHKPTFIKIFLDGTPPAFSGAFLHPYLDDGHHGNQFLGETVMPFDELKSWLIKVGRLGISAKIHCSGDAAVRMVLDAVAEVRKLGLTETTYHVAHGQFIDESDLPRFASLGVVAEASPFFWFPGVISDALRKVRPESEIARMHPNRTLLDSGALLAVGSDWPVSPTPDVWLAIQGLVTREDPTGSRAGTLAAAEAITIAEALAAVTIGGATALGLDEIAGSLTVGKSADFVVLDRDPYSTPVHALAATRIIETWMGGTRVFAA